MLAPGLDYSMDSLSDNSSLREKEKKNISAEASSLSQSQLATADAEL